MPRTDRQIAEYIEYYSKVPKKEREWALDNICKTENKTADEIRAIYEQYNGVVSLRKGTAMPDEFKELIRNKIREGMKGSDISEKYGVSGSAIDRLRADMIANGEKIPENRGKSSKKSEPERTEPTEEETELNQQQAEQLHPEAYPGQVYDDEPIVEEDVKVFIPGEQDEPKKPVPLAKALSDLAKIFLGEDDKDNTACACSQPSLWFALRDSLSEYLAGTFGAGTELTGESVEPDTERLVIRFRTADGKAMRCTLRSEGKHDRK